MRRIITTFLKKISMTFDCKLILKKGVRKAHQNVSKCTPNCIKNHSKLHQKCSQNCIRNVCKIVSQLCAKTVCKLCCKNCTFCVSKKVLQSDANEHFTRVSSRARKQTNKQTNKTPIGVREKRCRKDEDEGRILRSHSFPFLADAKTKPLPLFPPMNKNAFHR